MPDLAIVGAGPVGSLLALTLARRGYDVDVYERRPDMCRGELNKLLMTRAEETGRVRIHFGQRLIDYDPDRGVARFEPSGEVRAEVIIGSDGSASTLRAGLGGSLSQEVLSSGYKELTMPPKDGGFAMHRNALHIWPRGNFMLIALPNRDGSFTCTLFLPFRGSPSFAELETEADAARFFETWFPDSVPLIPGLARQFMQAPLGRMTTVKAWPWPRGSALLIGDAAHAIVPFFGQGMNAGFEDVTLLADLITGDWARDFARFAESRKPDTDAIADLAVENFVEMRDKVADPQFLRMREIERELQDRMPGRYLTRYQLVTFTRVPYRVALQAGEIQSRILSDLAQQSHPDYEHGVRLASETLVPLLR